MKILIVSSDYNSQPHKSIVDNIIKYIPEHEFDIYPCRPRKFFDADIIYHLNIMDVIKYGTYSSDMPSCVSIRSHRALQEYRAHLDVLLPYFKAVSGDNEKMLHFSIPAEMFKDPNYGFFVTPHSADPEVFKETNPINLTPRKIIVGYVGSFRDDKQYDIFQEACKEAKNFVIPKVVGKVSHKIPYDQMCTFYNSIDVLVCCSKQEGGPSPPLEAALCGRPIITTDVGFMRKAFGQYASYFNGSVAHLATKLRYFHDNREHLVKMGISAKKVISTKWTWKKLIVNYKEMFEYVASSS